MVAKHGKSETPFIHLLASLDAYETKVMMGIGFNDLSTKVIIGIGLNDWSKLEPM